MSKVVSLYIFDKDSVVFKRLDHIEILDSSLKDIDDPDVAIHIGANDSPYNKIIEDTLDRYSIWVSSVEGDVISSNVSVLWLSEPNDIYAIEKFLEYECKLIKNAAALYERTLNKSAKLVSYLHSQITNPKITISSVLEKDRVS